MPSINRLPRGLRDLLNYQAGGENPSELLESIRAQLDVFPYVASDLFRGIVEPFSLAAGQADFIEVPAQQLWLWNTWHVRGDVGIGETFYFEIQLERVQDLGLSPVSIFGDQTQEMAPATNAFAVTQGQQLPRLMLLTPGQRIVVRNTFGIGTVTGNLSVTFFQLDI